MQAQLSRCPAGVHCLSSDCLVSCLVSAPAQVLAPLAEVLSVARSLPSWYLRAGCGKATQRTDRAAAGLWPEPARAALTLRAWALRAVGRAPRGPSGQRCHSSALSCAPLALCSAPTTPASGRRLQSIAPLRVHTASSTPLPQAPAGLLQRCRPGAACCWAPALRSRALLLLTVKVSVGPVGLELDLWCAEYLLWPARAQRGPDSCKRSCLAAQQVCTASLQTASFLASFLLQPRYWLRWLRSCQSLAACHLGIYVQAAERPRNAQTGPRQDSGQNLRARRSLCAHGPYAPLAGRPGAQVDNVVTPLLFLARHWRCAQRPQRPRGQRCHSSALSCAPLALCSAPTTPASGRRLQSIAPLRVHTASSLHLSQAPAGLLQRCRPGAACCWAPALRSRALLLLTGKVSVGPVGLELDLWCAEYPLWPARAQRRPDSCKRSCLAAQQVCTAYLQAASFLASFLLQPRYWLRWLRSCQSLAACHLSIYVQAAERPRNAQTGPQQDFGQSLRTRRSLCAHGPCASLARRPGGPGGQRCHSSASSCAQLALRSAPTTPASGRRLQSIALLRVRTASSLHLSQAPAGLLQRCRPGAACCWAPALRSRALLLLMGKVSVGPVGLELDL